MTECQKAGDRGGVGAACAVGALQINPGMRILASILNGAEDVGCVVCRHTVPPREKDWNTEALRQFSANRYRGSRLGPGPIRVSEEP